MKKTNAILFLFIFSTGSAIAEKMPESATFEEMDTNGDKYISQQEASDRTDLKDNFARIDKNSDGKLDISEFSAFEAEGKFEPPDSDTPEPGAAPMKR